MIKQKFHLFETFAKIIKIDKSFTKLFIVKNTNSQFELFIFKIIFENF